MPKKYLFYFKKMYNLYKSDPFLPSTLPPLIHPKKPFLQHCPRRIAADTRKMRIYHWTRSDLRRYEITNDISQLTRKRKYSCCLQLRLNNKEKVNTVKVFPFLRRLTCLYIDFSSDQGSNLNITNKMLILFSQTICTLKNLSVLNLNLESCKKVSRKGLTYFASKLYKCRHLSKLVLNTESCRVTDRSLAVLSRSTTKLKYLSNLQVNMGNFRTTDHGLATFMTNITKSKTLVQLGIDLHLSIKYDVAALVGVWLPSIRQLSELRLDFSFCLDIGDEGIAMLSRSLLGLIHLNFLELSFQKCSKITDKGVIILGENIKKLNRLRRLHLLFLNCMGATESGIKNLAGNIVKLRCLDELHFGFGHWQNVTDEGFNSILEDLATALRLKDLKLVVEAHSPQGEGGLMTIANNLYRFTKMSKLAFRFHSRFITDRGIRIFSQNLVALSQLTHLKLDFNSKSRITDEGIMQLGAGLAQLPVLESLDLTLIQPRRFTEHGLFGLVDSIARYNPGLSVLKMIYYFCESIDDNAVIGLSQRLLKIKGLDSVKFVCFACPKVTDKGVAVFARNIEEASWFIRAYVDFILCTGISEKGNMILRELKD